MTGEIRGISDPDKTGSISVSQCASINREILPGDVGGTIADQELSHCTEIPGIAERMNRHSCEDRGFSFWSHDLLVHLTREPARRDAVDTDVVVCPLDGEPACQTADRRFADAVRNDLGEAEMRGHAADIDDASFMFALF